MPSSTRPSRLGDRTQVSCIGRRILYRWATSGVHSHRQHLAWRGKSSKRKKGPDSRRGLRLSGALAWTGVTQLSPRGAPDWLKPVALTRVFRDGGGPRGRKTSGISRSRRVCPAGWRLLCFTRGFPEMRLLRALRSRRWARRGPGENPGRFLLCVREHSTGPGLGERSWRVWARAHGMGGSRGKRVTLGRQEWASDPWMGNKGGRGAGKRNLLGSRVPFSPHWAPSYFSRPGYYLILLYSSSLLLLRLDS